MCSQRQEEIVQKLTKEDFSLEGAIRDGGALYNYSIDTRGLVEQYHTYSLSIEGNKCDIRKRGINLVVYDTDFHHIIDKVNIYIDNEIAVLFRDK